MSANKRMSRTPPSTSPSFRSEDDSSFTKRANRKGSTKYSLLEGAKPSNMPNLIIGSMILFLVGVVFFMGGLFPKRMTLTNKATVEDSPFYQEFDLDKPKKVILVLLDAVREDFVQIDDEAARFMDIKKSIY